MKKSELKSGMLLVDDRGRKSFLIGTEMFLIDGGSSSLNFYSDELEKNNGIGFKTKIMIVLNPIIPKNTNIGISIMSFLKGSDVHFEKIWARPEPVEDMTLEQVCKALGKDIKIVKG